MSAKVSATRDGEPSRVANLFCQDELQERETAPPTAAESAQTVKGTKVLWEFRGRHIPGTIERDNGDGTYDIAWTYGGCYRHEEIRTAFARARRLAPGALCSPGSARNPFLVPARRDLAYTRTAITHFTTRAAARNSPTYSSLGTGVET